MSILRFLLNSILGLLFCRKVRFWYFFGTRDSSFIMSQGGVVFSHGGGGTALKYLIQRGIFFIYVLSGAYESLTISLTEHGVYNAEN